MMDPQRIETMRKLTRVIAYVAAWLTITLVCGILGAWWPIHDIWDWSRLSDGDGIGVLIFGALGLWFGGLFAFFVVSAFARSLTRRRAGLTARRPIAGNMKDRRD